MSKYFLRFNVKFIKLAIAHLCYKIESLNFKLFLSEPFVSLNLPRPFFQIYLRISYENCVKIKLKI